MHCHNLVDESLCRFYVPLHLKPHCSAGYVELQDALSQLEVVSPRVARVVEARFFVGLSEQETATQMGVTTRTVQRDLEKAKKLLTGLLHS